MKAYIAGPFFSPSQLAIIEAIKKELVQLGIEYFSPKDESMFKQGDEPKVILDLNLRAILMSDLVIAVTDDKDVGTMFECGYAHSHGIPILYVWLGRKDGQKFNLMLAASGGVVHKVCDIGNYIIDNSIKPYDGPVE